MFDKIGEKIQSCAIVLFVVDLIAILVLSSVFMFEQEVLIGLLILFIGSGVSYVITLFIMGFGILVENSEDSNDVLNYAVYEKGASVKKKKTVREIHVVYCRNCGKAVESSYAEENNACPWCGKGL